MKNQHSQRTTRAAFTLIELLVVIAVIGILAGLITATAFNVVNQGKLKRAQAELKQLETVIEAYKGKKGFYPPDNRNNKTSDNYYQKNSLFYELVGANYLSSKGKYIPNVIYSVGENGGISKNDLDSYCGALGVANSSEGSGGDNSVESENFFTGLLPKQTQTNSAGVRFLIAPVDDGNTDFNIWRYNASKPRHNTDSYDLWAVILVGGKTNVICNWSDKPIVTTNPYP